MEWLRDRLGDAEQAYRDELREQRLGTHVRMAALVIAAINTIFIGLDYYVFTERFADFLWVRIALNAVLAWSYFYASHTRPVAGQVITCLATGVMLLVVIYGTGAPASDYYVGLVLFAMGTPVLLPLRAMESAAFSGLFVAAFAVSPLIVEVTAAPGVEPAWAWRQFGMHCFFLAGALLTGIASSYLLDRARFRDFVQRRHLELARDELRELDRAKSRFSANIHHELRTPLTLILAPVEALISGEFGEVAEPQRRYLETVCANAQRLLRLINNLLDVSKIESNQLNLHRRPLQIGRVTEDLVASVRPTARSKSIAITTRGMNDLPEIHADLDAVEKILLNLIGNALKFTERNGRIEVVGEADEGGARITVSDDGAGIPKEQLERIFDRFAQVDGSATRRHEGTGIGLALAKELVDLHGGHIWADSDGPGRGARFCFALPRGEADAGDSGAGDGDDGAPERDRTLDIATWKGAAVDDPAESNAAGIGAPASAPAGGPPAESPARIEDPAEWAVERRRERKLQNRARLLVVEDSTEMRHFLATILGAEYRVETAANGREGLEAAIARRPDLVVTDVMMPEMSGTDLCRALEREPKTRGVPVVLLTAKADREMKVEGLELGARDYVTKPFHPRELLARVRSIVQIEKLQRELAQRNAILESTIFELKQTEVQLVQAERLAAVGELAAGVAHEVNNPVNFAINSLQTLRTRVGDVRLLLDAMAEIDPNAPDTLGERLHKLELLEEEIGFRDLSPELEELVAIATDGLQRTHRLVGDLHNFAGHGPAVREPVKVTDGLSSTVRLMRRAVEEVGAVIETEYAADVPVIDSAASVLNQVYLNLIKNATEAIEGRRGATIRVTARYDESEDEVVIVVSDNGPGIDPKIRKRLFDPFVTTKTAGKGAGLGLSVCRRILGELGGTIELADSSGSGAAFEIRLPADAAPEGSG